LFRQACWQGAEVPELDTGWEEEHAGGRGPIGPRAAEAWVVPLTFRPVPERAHAGA